MAKPQTPPYLVIGEILRPHGVQGEVRVRLTTDYPERLKTLKHVFLGTDARKKNAEQYQIATVRFHQDYALIRFETITDRNKAELLRNRLVLIDIENAVPLAEDEFYAYELIGMVVKTERDEVIGEIIEVMETGANDVFVVSSPVFGEVLIPAHDKTLLEVNTDLRYVLMRLPEGLLPA